MDLSQIRKLLKIVAESSVAEVEVEEDGVKIVVRKNAATVMVQAPSLYPSYGAGYASPAFPPMPPMYPPVSPMPVPGPPPAPLPATPPAPAASNPVVEPAKEEAAPEAKSIVVHAPIVGTFYEAPAPDAEPFVKVGDRVQPGDVLCIIEAMKLMNEIESEVAGTIRQILAKNSEPVEYDQPLFVIDPA